jgi:hypothetical protein
MSRTKRGTPANDIYNSTLFGGSGRFNNNPAIRREADINRLLQRNLTELAVNRFKWVNLPESIDARFLEMCLFFNALVVFYWDKDYDKLLAVRGTGTGFVNMLDNPVSFSVIGPGSLIKPVTDTAPAQFQNKTIQSYSPAAHEGIPNKEQREKAFPIWANYLRAPEIDTVNIYASRLAWIDRTLEINTRNARRNKVVTGSQNMQLSMVNAVRSMDQGDELIQLTGPMQDMEFVQALDLGVTPESYEKLSILRGRIWNDAMTLFGIDSANQEKKERMVVAEVGANDNQTDSFKYISLNSRQQAVERINKVFGLNIEVDYRAEMDAREEAEKNAELNGQQADKTDDADSRLAANSALHKPEIKSIHKEAV